jgi:hypothetical protein
MNRKMAIGRGGRVLILFSGFDWPGDFLAAIAQRVGGSVDGNEFEFEILGIKAAHQRAEANRGTRGKPMEIWTAE